MKTGNVINEKNCNNCFFKQSKKLGLNNEITAWCWRFDHETNHNDYCKDKYYININDGGKKFNNMGAKIAGYIERKEDFDRTERNKYIINILIGIMGVVIGTLFG